MKICIISDVHGNIFGLRAVLTAMGSVDKVIFAGDVAGYYYWINECIELLQEYQAEMILGNHDVYLLQYLGYNKPEVEKTLEIPTKEEYVKKYGMALEIARKNITSENIRVLQSLSPQKSIHIADKKLLIVHGSPWEPISEYIYPDYKDWNKFLSLKQDIIIIGHTHHPMVQWMDEIVLINPGSCGQPRDYDPRAAYAVLDLESNTATIHRVDYDVSAVITEINRVEPNNELIKKILLRKKTI